MEIVSNIPSLPFREKDAHKGSCGKVLVVAGSMGMTGAAILSAQAALRSGAGMVYLAMPESLNDIIEVRLIEVITRPQPETPQISIARSARHRIVDLSKECDVVAIGPGLSQVQETSELVLDLLCDIEKPIVLDADGINALNDDVSVLTTRPAATIITPHPGEMARFAGVTTGEVQSDRQGIAVKIAKKHNIIVVLKGHETVVADKGRVYVNKTGNPGMATAGSGDVLTGIIAGLLGQTGAPFDSAVLGVFLHGLAGDLAAENFGIHSLIASDILNLLPKAFIKSAEI